MMKCAYRAALTWLAIAVMWGGSPTELQAEAISLREPINDSRTFSITVQVQAKGTLKTPVKEDAAAELPLELRARMAYLERRLPAAGRDDRAWRAIRRYESAGSNIKVKDQATDLKLSDYVKSVIAEGDRAGLRLYAEEMPLQRKDVDLLNVPGDPLAVLAALPPKDIEVGESWTVPEWAAQMVAGVEAATKTKLTGKLISVENGLATLQFVGDVEGATTGAATKVVLNGTATFRVNEQYLASLKLIQQEERGISTVSPGMKVTATVQWERTPSTGARTISDEKVAGIPFDPPPIADLLLFQSRFWKIGLLHERHWHVFQEIPEVAVLRLVEAGSLISQCNIARIPKMAPGTHVDPAKFERDIKVSLGEQLDQIVEAAEVPTENGLYVYRVVASGGNENLQMMWIYYLCAHPDGRQVSFVFAVEQSNLEALNSRDLSMVESVEFEPEK